MTAGARKPDDALVRMGEIAAAAGRELVVRYAVRTGLAVRYKADRTPVTDADDAAQAIIAAGLAEAFPGVPVISEESALPGFEARKDWPEFFLVDPLDGTKGFVQGTGDFCVNIALVHGRYPVAGVIFLPLTGELFAGGPELGAWRIPDGESPLSLHPQPVRPEERIVLTSRARRTPRLDAYMAGKPYLGKLHVGGAVKFCMLASGFGQIYPCFHPTSEWDTAAGQALLEGAGGSVRDLHGDRFRYNKPSLENEFFVAGI
ncbi:3'(2'),5'-bisphosphate nucleotidase CysQ [Oceanidesulfovibrio marinus]|uniref:3'(2'),5'-bisphosphate nucleotidase CysQ n=1 Tax=Oceanidesulfovibrio marinus TaxID=370038 RepID=A0A6P1ZIE1_9BACT|nr:3'(2'),5'-bisphosphate nucleotidase CysQ [Oceanidesulfovibrio marinus]TVM32779.1 3'(2'),5'-bisphosphate nucleotidase [Oceanidesulfovibrio marinus]